MEAVAEATASPNIDNDFSKTIEESKNAVHLSTIEPKRKGRGRPRKNDTVASGSGPSTSTPNNGGQSVTMGSNTPEIKTYLVGPLVAISKIPAHNYQVKELALTEDEAMLCADSLQQVLNAFIPDVNRMNPKTAAIFGACITFGSIGFQKYAVFQAHRPAPKKPEPKKENPVQSEAPEVPSGAVASKDYFKTVSAPAPL